MQDFSFGGGCPCRVSTSWIYSSFHTSWWWVHYSYWSTISKATGGWCHQLLLQVMDRVGFPENYPSVWSCSGDRRTFTTVYVIVPWRLTCMLQTDEAFVTDVAFDYENVWYVTNITTWWLIHCRRHWVSFTKNVWAIGGPGDYWDIMYS